MMMFFGVSENDFPGRTHHHGGKEQQDCEVQRNVYDFPPGRLSRVDSVILVEP